MKGVGLTFGLFVLFVANAAVSYHFRKKRHHLRMLRSEMDEDDFEMRYEDRRRRYMQTAIGSFILALMFLAFFLVETFA